MREHEVRTRRSAEEFPRTEHLAWKIAEVAADPVAVPPETEAMVINRIIDNAAVSAASVIRRPVTVAREQALAHARRRGAAVFGVDGKVALALSLSGLARPTRGADVEAMGRRLRQACDRVSDYITGGQPKLARAAAF